MQLISKRRSDILIKSVIETYRLLSNSRKIPRDNDCYNNAHALAIFFPHIGLHITNKRGWLLFIRPIGKCEKPDSWISNIQSLTLLYYQPKCFNGEMKSKEKEMNKLKFLVGALITVLASVNCISCSDDDQNGSATTDLSGIWRCVETNYVEDDSGYSSSEKGFLKGTSLIFFNGEFKSADGMISGKKCFIVDAQESDNLTNYTELAWNRDVDVTHSTQEFPEVYNLSGNNLTIMECDLDRFVGTISINGNEMTYTYKYQNWQYSTGLITSESKVYTSRFRKE